MIKIFRNIRQELVMKNRTGRYLKYAIGEIVLVVIGILIALQINNWNEDRKTRLEESILLKNLLIDFKDNKKELEADIAGKIKVIGSINTLYEIISKEVNFSDSEIDSLLNITMTVINFTTSRNTLSAITGNGKIDIIRNEQLKNLFSKWTYAENKNKLYTSYVTNQFSNDFTALLKQSASYRNIYKYRPKDLNPNIPDSVYKVVTNVKSPFQNNYEALFSNITFENTLRSIERGQMSSLNSNYDMLQIANEVLTALNTEIDQ